MGYNPRAYSNYSAFVALYNLLRVVMCSALLRGLLSLLCYTAVGNSFWIFVTETKTVKSNSAISKVK